jgi:hypothetical protein
MEFFKIAIEDVIGNLSDISNVNVFERFLNSEYDLFIQAIGFEARTIAVAEKLSGLKTFKTKEVLLIKYKTNIEDNLFYEKDLRIYVNSFTKRISTFINDDEFNDAIKQKIHSSISTNKPIRVIVDFSSLSSRLILSLSKIIFQYNIDLTILYAEGKFYHPTEAEFEKLINKKGGDSKLSQSYGVEDVIISPEYNGGTKENQDLVICFPSFKAERTEAIITKIDDIILKQKDKKRLIWIIGDPHMDEPQKSMRRKIQKQINSMIEETDKIYYVDTLDYKKTLLVLDHIYKDVYESFHINISDLGSKMQSFGIAIFATLRRDVTVYYSEPTKYNPLHYSEGVKDFWIIEIGNTLNYIKELIKVDLIEDKNHD